MGVGPGGRNCGTGRVNDRAAEAGSWLAVTSRRSKGRMVIAGGNPRASPTRVSGARGPRKQSPLGENDNGRDRPLSLLCLLPLPALLRHVMSGRRRDYFRSHAPPHSGGFRLGLVIAPLS